MAVVNQENIYKADFQWELDRFTSRYNLKKNSPVNGQRTPKDTVLGQLIHNKIFEQEIKRLNIMVSVKELEKELRYFTGEYTSDQLLRTLKEKKTSLKNWKNELRRNLLIKKLIDMEVLKKIRISEKEMRDYFEANRSDFSLPQRVEVSQIIVAEEADAHSIYKDLVAGADFSQKAKEYSLGPESNSGGQMGIFSPGQLPDEFDQVIFKLKPGQFSEVIRTPYGYHLFQVVRQLEEKKLDFEEAKVQIRKILLKEKEEVAYERWLKHLKAKSKIVVNDKVLSSFSGS